MQALHTPGAASLWTKTKKSSGQPLALFQTTILGNGGVCSCLRRFWCPLSTLVAITGQLVRLKGCSDIEGYPFRELCSPSVERFGARVLFQFACRILTFFHAFQVHNRRVEVVADGFATVSTGPLLALGPPALGTPRLVSPMRFVQEGSAPPQDRAAFEHSLVKQGRARTCGVWCVRTGGRWS